MRPTNPTIFPTATTQSRRSAGRWSRYTLNFGMWPTFQANQEVDAPISKRTPSRSTPKKPYLAAIQDIGGVDSLPSPGLLAPFQVRTGIYWDKLGFVSVIRGWSIWGVRIFNLELSCIRSTYQNATKIGHKTSTNVLCKPSTPILLGCSTLQCTRHRQLYFACISCVIVPGDRICVGLTAAD